MTEFEISGLHEYLNSRLRDCGNPGMWVCGSVGTWDCGVAGTWACYVAGTLEYGILVFREHWNVRLRGCMNSRGLSKPLKPEVGLGLPRLSFYGRKVLS